MGGISHIQIQRYSNEEQNIKRKILFIHRQAVLKNDLGSVGICGQYTIIPS